MRKEAFELVGALSKGINDSVGSSVVKPAGKIKDSQGINRTNLEELYGRDVFLEDYLVLVLLHASSAKTPMTYKQLFESGIISGSVTDKSKYGRIALSRVKREHEELNGIVEERLMDKDPKNPLGRQQKGFYVAEENKHIIKDLLAKMETTPKEDQKKPVIKVETQISESLYNKYTKSDAPFVSKTGIETSNSSKAEQVKPSTQKSAEEYLEAEESVVADLDEGPKESDLSENKQREKKHTDKKYELTGVNVSFLARVLLVEFAGFTLKGFGIILTNSQKDEIKEIKNGSDYWASARDLKSSGDIIKGFKELRVVLSDLISARKKFIEQNSKRNRNLAPVLSIFDNIKTHEKLDDLMVGLCNHCLRSIDSPEISLEALREEKVV